jgi:hypothetical protein
VVTGWGYGLWAIAKDCTNSYVQFDVAMGRAMGESFNTSSTRFYVARQICY